MPEWAIVVVKGLAGGTLVVAFALLSELLEPKRFAGLFGAAPAVALASLSIVLISKGAHDARENSIGMLAGCLGMVCYALATARLQRSGHSLAGSALGLLAWIAPTGALAAILL